MRIPRFHTEQPLSPGQSVMLEEPGSHHLLRVLRLCPGEPLMLFNGDGKEYLAVLETTIGKQAVAMVQSARQPDRESKLRIALGQGISRGERMDFVLQKSVELGVDSITPLWTKRCQVQLSGKRLDKRQLHWRGIVRSACEQSGRVYLPRLHSATSPQAWYHAAPQQALRIVFEPEARLHLCDLTPAENIRVLIGPEGGLDAEEIRAAEACGFQRVRMGPRTLRTETAALTALAALQTLWGDLAAPS